LLGDSVTVSWSGVEDPKATDWIGIYLDTNADHTDYLDFTYVTGSPTFESGFGSLTFALTNMRTAYQFRYFRYQGIDAYVLVAVSEVVTFANLDEPLQGHIAIGDSVRDIRVMFTTNGFDTPRVQYGTASGAYTLSASGTSVTYRADMMCGSPATTIGANYFINPGVMHDVLLPNLALSTRYYYRFGTNSSGWSEERSFVTPPPVGHTNVRFIAYGDLGVTTPGPKGTVELVYREIEETGMIVHFGDVSYARGQGYLWDQYMSFVEPIASRTPYMVSVGNHEQCHVGDGTKDPSGAPGTGFHPTWGNYENDSGGECGVPMYYRYTMPGNGNSLFWYSFDYGNVHIIQMSSEHDFLPGSIQYNWMEADLARVNRTLTPFVVFTSHRPLYNSERYPDDYRVAENMRIAFEDLLVKYKVDVALYGHYHSYERTCAVYKEVCDPVNGLVHITVGSAGAWADVAGYYDEVWSVFAVQEYGFCRVTTTEDELLVEFILNSEARVIDSVTLKRKF